MYTYLKTVIQKIKKHNTYVTYFNILDDIYEINKHILNFL